jgi:hypothetical protein
VGEVQCGGGGVTAEWIVLVTSVLGRLRALPTQPQTQLPTPTRSPTATRFTHGVLTTKSVPVLHGATAFLCVNRRTPSLYFVTFGSPGVTQIDTDRDLVNRQRASRQTPDVYPVILFGESNAIGIPVTFE